MMQSLIGIISGVERDMVDKKTSLRFKDRNQFKTPEALIIHEQQIISDERLLEACQREYNTILYTPRVQYIPKDILQLFEQYDVVVIEYSKADGSVTLGMLPEFKDQMILSNLKVKRILVPIYYYVEVRTNQYFMPSFLAELPCY